MDNFYPKYLSIHVAYAIKGYDVVDVNEHLGTVYGLCSKRIQVDNGSELISKVLNRWPYDH